MGTDINAMVEVQDASGRWRPVIAPVWPNAKYHEEPGQKPFGMMPVIARHYGLFSVLADVRNRTGRGTVTMQKVEVPEVGEVEFAYDTDDGGHDPLVPLDLPRGTPDDANEGWRTFTSHDFVHDSTWFTLAELEAGPWDQVIHEQAIVSEQEYLTWRDTGQIPQMHSRGIGGPGMRVVTVDEYEAGERGQQTAVDFRWIGRTVYEDAPNSWWLTLTVMQLVAPEGDPEKVRLLLAFDS
jgi:hypothetical protein